MRLERASAARHRLQTLEGQALGILPASEVKPADEGSHLLAGAVDLSERKGIGADPGIEEFDPEGALRHRPRLPDQLIEPLSFERRQRRPRQRPVGLPEADCVRSRP
jgi:hypothetical protein